MGSHSCHGSYRGVSSYHCVKVRREAASVLNDVDLLFMMRFFMRIFMRVFIRVFVGIFMSVSVESLVTFERFAFTFAFAFVFR